MIFQEKYHLSEDNGVFFSKQFELFIVGWDFLKNERSSHVFNSLLGFKGTILELNVCDNIDKLEYRITDNSGKVAETKRELSLIPDLQNLIKKRFHPISVCIDITSLKQAALFLLIKIFFKDYKPKRIFAAYTEPLLYPRKDITPLVGAEEFDLYDKLMEISVGVPGFTEHRDFNKDDLLIASFGFESQRVYKVFDNIKPKKLIPILGFPSFVPGWNITALKMNHITIRQSDCQDDIEKCEASSPFDAYQKLGELFEQYSENYQIILSPMGTRPHLLGFAMFAANHTNTYLVYDFPIEKKFRSEGVLRASIFHLTHYIKY